MKRKANERNNFINLSLILSPFLVHFLLKVYTRNIEFDRQFGQFVKELRVEKRWSQADLADRIENNFQNISRLERGETTPILFWCYKLSKVFNLEFYELIQKFSPK